MQTVSKSILLCFVFCWQRFCN